ncbi:MAG: hypothetical protein NTW98_02640, partial [Candidatus Nomurabacteria bacterium]|nr:hypothetical protein [Candidatus Nomurabacteria bacterium]
MSILLISFFISLVGISAMIGRRLVILKRKHVLRAEAFTYDFAIEVPDFDEVKDVAHKNLKKISYKALVYTLR